MATLDVIDDVIFMSATFTADMILYWRFWVIWSRDRWTLLVPVAAVIMAVIGNAFLLKYDINMIKSYTDAMDWKYLHAAETMLTLDVVMTWLTTLLIIYKLYRVGHRAMAMTANQTNKYLRIILALIESGALLSVVLGIFVGFLYGQVWTGDYLITPSLTRVVGTVPLLIILQLSLGYKQPGDTPNCATRITPGAAVVRETQPTPTAPPRRRDSLSLDISSLHASDVTPTSAVDPEKALDAKDWAEMESGKAHWVTVGGTDIARQLRETEHDDDLERAQVRPKSSGF